MIVIKILKRNYYLYIWSQKYFNLEKLLFNHLSTSSWFSKFSYCQIFSLQSIISSPTLPLIFSFNTPLPLPISTLQTKIKC